MCSSSHKKHNILTLTEENTLRTSDHFGSATVIVEESLHVNQLRSAYYIEVAPINSMVIEHGTQIIIMPLGADVVLKIVYQDKFGRSFAPSINQIINSI